MALNHDLVSAAMSAMVGCPVITYEEYQKNPSADYQPLDIEAFHKSVLVAPASQPQREHDQPSHAHTDPNLISRLIEAIHIAGLELVPRSINVFVKTLTGKTITISVALTDTIDHLKQRIADKADLPPGEHRLMYAGKDLQGHLTLHDYGIQQDSTLHLALRIRGGGPTGMYLPQNFLDPPYDYDFTNVHDTSGFSRGGEKYIRPCGWLRFALKVGGKYGPDVWLGSSNAPGEWPVSYHGTSRHNAESIAEEGFKLSKGVRFAYGRGIYSTPSPGIAADYAQQFQHQGKRYKVVIQNRVNPQNLDKIPQIDYWVSPGDADIRPYGLCIRQA